MTIPNYIQRQLDAAPEGPGNRHKDIVELAYQMVGERMPDEVILSLLRARYPDKDKPDSEFRRAIAGAHKRNPQPADGAAHESLNSILCRAYDGDASKVVRFEVEDKPIPEGIPAEPCTMLDFLKTVFKPGETVCIVTQSQQIEDSGKYIPANAGTFITLEKWEELVNETDGLKSYYNKEAGAWVRVNPIKPADETGTDSAISAYRHVLVEFDSIPKLEQYRIFKECKLPIAALIDSGAKSLHAWIKVDAGSAEQFRERQKRVYDYLGKYLDDKGNKNPSRLSRLPGIQRGENMQSVVALSIGAETWQQWEEWNINDGLPDPIEESDLIDKDIPEPNQIIKDILAQGRILTLGGPSKTNKSWNLINCGYSVASGKDWLGWDCNASKVLYVNFELAENTMRKRIKAVKEARGIAGRVPFTAWNLRGESADIEKIVDRFEFRLRNKGYGLIIIDPAYMCYGWRDENKTGDMADFFRHIMRLCKVSGAAVAIATHYAKGNAHEKSANDRTSGSGVFTRYPDAIIQATPARGERQSNPKVFEIDTTLREFQPQPQVHVEWNFPLMRRVADPEQSGDNGFQSERLLALVDLLKPEGFSNKVWAEEAAEIGIGRTNFGNLRAECVKLGLVTSEGEGKAKRYFKDPEEISAYAKENSGPRVELA